MLSSTIIPTIGRSTLSRSVCSILDQEFNQGDFEVIVVNDSGKPLVIEEWMQSARVKVIHTNRRNRSVARNTGAAVAQGEYMHFLDDDDWMLPGAFQYLWEAASRSRAGWVYGGFQLVNNEGELIQEIYPAVTGNCYIQMIAAEWIPLQASWVQSRAFFEAGGFASLFSLGGGYEDIDLSRMIAQTYDFARTSKAIANIRAGDSGSTTDYNNLIRQNRISREKGLDSPGAFTRMRSSLHSNTENISYWNGRIVYYYLASVRSNLKQKRVLKATSRAFYTLLALALSGRHLPSSSFWQGVSKPHVNLVRASYEETGARPFRNTVWR